MAIGRAILRVNLALVCLCLATAGQAQLMTGGWPKYRHDIRGTSLSQYSGPAGAMLGWTYTTGAGISSSPAVGSDGSVYVLSQDGFLCALNANGTLRWRYFVNSNNSSSPAIGSDGVVYIASEDTYVYAINPAGGLKWRRSLGKQIRASLTVGTDGMIYVGAMNNNFYALTSAGSISWFYTTGGPIISSAAIDTDGTIYFGSQDAYLYALNPSGTRKWRYRASGHVDSSPAIDSTGLIYTGSSDGKVYAITQAGTLRWSYGVGTGLGSSPAVGPDGTVYIGSDGNYVYALNNDGTLKWRYLTGGDVDSSPAVGSDGIIYVGSSDHYLYALDPNGTLLWRYDLGNQVYCSPAIAPDGTLYVGSYDKNVYAFAKDNTPPSTPVVTDDGVFAIDATSLHAVWGSSDPESGISEYQYAIGTSPGATDVVSWTSAGTATGVTRAGLSLVDGTTYYFAAKAKNGSGLWSAVGTSDGIMVDAGPPTTPAVADDGDYTLVNSSLHATWTAQDPQSGIAEYQYAIGTTSGGTNVVGWTPVGTATQATQSGLSLADGVRYYFAVKARNAGGLWSAVGVSDGIAVDTSAPSTPAVTDDGNYSPSSGSLHASWNASDAQSGIAEYQYAIGTSPGATDIAGWTSVGAATQATRTGLSLTDGSTYYFAVKARNGGGLWSAVGLSDGIIVDASAPASPAVTDDGDYTTVNTSLHAAWTGQDTQSGIAEYQYAIGTTSGGTEVVSWTSVLTATQVTKTGLSLTDGVKYYLSVKAKNGAGLWSAVGASDGITVDAGAPTTPAVTDDGDYTLSSDNLHASWNSSDPHTGIAEYQYAIGTTPGGTDVAGWTSAGTGTQITKAGLALADGTTYYFAVKAKNGAGLWSAVGASDGIMVDTSAPSTPAVTDDGIYTSTSTSLHAAWSATDPHSGIAEYQYAIGTTPGGVDVVGWTSVGAAAQVSKAGLSLADGVGYYFAVKARNAAGRWSDVGVSDGITADTTGPSTPVVTDDGEYTSSNTSLHAAWSAGDPHSGIKEYQYAIGTSPGASDVVGWTSAGTATEVSKTSLVLTDGATYYFAVKAQNGAGLWSAVGASDGIAVDSSLPPAPSVTDDGNYTSNSTSLHATWIVQAPPSGIAEYQYAIGTTSGGTEVVGWTSAGTATQVTKAGLSLMDGVKYYFTVKARNNAGRWGDIGVSDGITVDTSPAQSPSVTDDGSYTSVSTSLHAAWSAADPHSGIDEYQYAIGTTSGGTDIVGWTSTSTGTSVTKTGLSLTSGTTYYFAVKAKNGASLWSTAGTSDGILVDTSAPSAPAVTDDGVYTSSTTSLHATWACQDAQSGIAEYQYAIGSTSGGTEIVGWTSVGTATAATKTGLSLTNGAIYYLAVKAKNGAGLWSAVGASDGITVDASAPLTPTVTDDGVYTVSSSTLHASWNASDPQSGIGEYDYAIGTTSGGTDIVGWTPAGTATQVTKTELSLVDGVTYYFAVKAKNGAGLWSTVGTSDGIMADTSAPSTPAVTDDGDYTSVNASLHAVWVAQDLQSGVVEYQYAIGTTSGGTEIVGWTSTGTATQVTKAGLSLADGVKYYLAVKAKNGAGVWSAVGTSDGITVDASQPAVPTVTDDGAYTSSSTGMHATWACQDAQSGIVEYQYAIGTTAGGTDVAGWTSAGTATQVTKTGLSLVDGVTYYFAVKAKNGAGLWSSAGLSDGITVDTSPSSMPVVTDDGAYTSSNASLHASWTSSDSHSGIAEYQYAIGTTSGGTEVVGWTSAGTATQVTKAGLSLTDGVKYYFAVKALDGAGLWSAVGSSDGITVDTSAPSTPAVTDDGEYTPVTTSLHAAWSAQDLQSGVVEYQYAIGTTSGGTEVVGWTSAGTATQVTMAGLSLADGVKYYFAVKAKSGAGLWSTAGTSDGITVDASPSSTPVVTDDGDYTSSTTSLHASWTSSDTHSGIAEYQYAIGTTSGGTEIVGWTSAGTATQISKTGLSLANGITYYFAVKAKNGSGIWSAVGTSNGIVVDVTPPPAPVVTDDGAYTSTGTSLHASWSAQDPQSGIAEYQYAIGTTAGDTDAVGWTSAGAATQVTRTGLSLTDGLKYYFSVKAENRAGGWSSAGVSDGITVDASSPTPPVVTDDGDYTASLDTLHASWTSSDPHTGITEYQYAIGTFPGATDVVSWTSAGAALEVTKTGLTLSDSVTYYFAVKAKNGTGLWSAVGTSDGISVSTTSVWPRFRQNTKNQGISNYIGPQSAALLWAYPTMGWVESAPALSGNGTVYVGSGDGSLYAISHAGALLWKYTAGDSVDTSPCVGKDGKVYFGSYDGYLYCVLPNGTLSWRFCTGDMVWSSPLVGPDDTVYFGCQNGTMYAVTKDGVLKWKLEGMQECWSSPALSDDGILYFGAGDGCIYALYASTGVVKWRYQTGSAIDSSPMIGPDGVVYQGSGDAYFYAINPNGTKKWSFYSGGWAVDSSAAIAPDGTVYVGTGSDWLYGYLFAIRPNGTLKWQFDAHGEVRSSPSVGGDGTVYFGSGDGNVYALNPNGTMKWKYDTGSAVLSSFAIGKDGMIVIGSYTGDVLAFKDSGISDTTPPTTPAVTDGGVATSSGTTLSAAWSATDPESGVQEYTYAIGTWPGADDVAAWTSAGAATSVTRTDLSLTIGTPYYFSVKARNAARLWSAVGASDGIVAVGGQSPVTIGQAKLMTNDALVLLTGKAVTGRFDGSFYIEEADRSAGVKLLPNGLQSPVQGSKISLVGKLVSGSGEKAIRLSTITVDGTATCPRPLGMSSKLLGGTSGWNNVGLLASIWGSIVSVCSGCFYVDDGNGVKIGSGPVGVKVSTAITYPGTTITLPVVNDYVTVLGIVSMEWTGTDYRLVVRPRSQDDIQKVP